MGMVFGKAVETRHGNYAAGEPLPPEWDTRETRKQLIEQFGEGVLVQARTVSNESMAAELSAIKQSLTDIKDALGIKAAGDGKALGDSKSKGRA